MSSAPFLLNTCAVCGAEEGLDGLLARMIDDDQVRRLVADVITQSLPLGGQVVSYLRLHKPARQRLRMAKVGALLADLVPDLRRGFITRKGREWQAGPEAWRTAFAAVFEARDKGTLDLPLEGNAYLYEVLCRQADKAEGTVEREREQGNRARSYVGGPQDLGGVFTGLLAMPPAPPALAPAALPPVPAPAQTAPVAPAPVGPSAYARRVQAEIAAMKARRGAAAVPAEPTAAHIDTTVTVTATGDQP